jgi:hypothetical protein
VQLVDTVRRFWKRNGLLLKKGHNSTFLYRVRGITLKDVSFQMVDGAFCIGTLISSEHVTDKKCYSKSQSRRWEYRC